MSDEQLYQEEVRLVDPNDIPGMKALAEQFTDVKDVFYSSIPDDGSRESKIAIYNAMNNTVGSIRSLIGAKNDTLRVSNIIAHMIQLLDEKTGEIVSVPRLVLVTPEGEGYHAVSNGMLSSMKKLIGLFGPAPWEPPVVIKPRRVPTRSGFETMVFEILG